MKARSFPHNPKFLCLFESACKPLFVFFTMALMVA